MAGWTSDDSNLNSSCPFCGASFVPFLNAEVCDLGPVSSAERGNWNVEDEVESAARPPGDHEAFLRHQCNGLSEDSSSETSSYSENSRTTKGSSGGGAPQVTVAYLSPLVLRKELESLLENEGEAVLAQPQFLDSHCIIFWNLVWYFQRLGLPSNLLQLVRASPLVGHFTQSDSSAVRVRLLWDTLAPDTDQWPPLYVLWRIHSGVPMRSHSWRRHNHPFTLAFLEEVLRWVGMNEVHKAVTLFLDTLAKQPGSPQTQRSLYREFLFLTLAAMGKDHVGAGFQLTDSHLQFVIITFSLSLSAAAFDKKYKAAYSRLSGTLAPKPSTADAASTRIKHRSTEHNSSLMMSESELDSDQDTIFSRDRPVRSRNRLGAPAGCNGNAFG
ncbi:putative DENN domain-containing protein 4B-like [Scophthalmus maximus]|uniref:Putative DENN domain-containing protein 4B-like n=1 Tax=Scophthalmus maximus TaxID=52904 RepID=A0A2U9CM58_SCOMX|nr:putative DENN domain-containing protein 4B-like [Scophthalmus maximus]